MRTENPEKLNTENRAVRSYMIDMVIMLSIVAVVAVYTYGTRAVQILLFTLVATLTTEAIGYALFMRKKPERLFDLSAVFTALAIALAVPSSSPLWMAPIGGIFAIAIAKLPFGNATSTPFVPAAAGIAFLSVSYPDLMFTYPSLSIGSLEAVTYGEGFISGTSLATMLDQSKSIGTTILNVLDIFVGRIPGPMGASCFILMLGTFIYMLIRRHSGFITTASFIAACSLMSVLFPRVLTGRTYSLLMELSAGLLFFAAVFFISDPVTSPKNQLGKVIYGASAGFVTMLFRYFGNVESAVCFVVLIANAISPLFDVWGQKLGDLIQEKSKVSINSTKKLKMNNRFRTQGEVSDEGGILDHE